MKNKLLLSAFAAAVIASPVPSAHAQVGGGAGSGKVIRLVVPFGAGGARELLARAFHTELGAALGETIVIENRPGAGGAIGTAVVAKAEPDGRTLVFAASSHNVTALLSPSTANYDPVKDFTAVGHIGIQSYVMMGTAQVAAKTVAEVIREAKANPGKLNYSSAGAGSSTHLAMAYFTGLAGVDMVHIPYKGTQDSINDVLAGRSHVVVVPNIGATTYLKDARIRILAVTAAKRTRFFPGVPTVAESGLPGYAFDSWFGILAPAKTPRAVQERINAAVAKVLRDPVVMDRLEKQGVEDEAISIDDFNKLLRADLDKMAKVIKAAGAGLAVN